ncbi:tyrosinase family protein [Streptomyces halstedii]|uniref:tyrosinase family protein n=1 Tax=Streptomyces halstedii TaxID=1944 RepID=UPI0038641CEE
MLEGWIPPGVHNMVHQWVGGAMEPPSSPNEPAFFLHHCNLDRLWAEWRQRHPGAPYVPVSGAPPGSNLSDVLPPWNERTIADLLDHRALGYQYDTEFPLPQGHQMLPGDTLVGGNEVRSGNGTYVLGYQTDGNLVLYPAADPHNVVWATGTWKNRDAGRCTINFDGTLRVYGKGAPGQAPDQWHRPNARPPRRRMPAHGPGRRSHRPPSRGPAGPASVDFEGPVSARRCYGESGATSAR